MHTYMLSVNDFVKMPEAEYFIKVSSSYVSVY